MRLKTCSILYGKAPSHLNELGHKPRPWLAILHPQKLPSPCTSKCPRFLSSRQWLRGPIHLKDYLASLLILFLRPNVVIPQFTGQISLRLPASRLQRCHCSAPSRLTPESNSYPDGLPSTSSFREERAPKTFGIEEVSSLR